MIKVIGGCNPKTTNVKFVVNTFYFVTDKLTSIERSSDQR